VHTVLYVINDELIFVTGNEGHAKEFSRVNVLLTEELAVAASAVH